MSPAIHFNCRVGAPALRTHSAAEDPASERWCCNGQLPAFRDAAAYDAAMTLMLATLQAIQQNKLKNPDQVTGAMIRDSMRAINDRKGEPVDAGAAG